jgi:hypothetical protein
MILMLYTGQRRGDAVRMGRQHMTQMRDDDGVMRWYIAVRQEKTTRRCSSRCIPSYWRRLSRTRT